MELADANKWEMVKGYQQLKAQRQRQQAEAEEQGLDRGDIKDTPEHWIQARRAANQTIYSSRRLRQVIHLHWRWAGAQPRAVAEQPG